MWTTKTWCPARRYDRLSTFDAGSGLAAAGCSSTRTRNPYALVTPVTQIIRDMSADQVVERAATLEDIRAEVLTPDRLNTVVFGGFAAVALAIAVVGVAGVLAFSVSGTDARVRHPAGHRVAAAASSDRRDRRRRGDGGGGDPAGAAVRLRAGDIWRAAIFRICRCRMRCR